MPKTLRLAIFLSITAALWAQGGPDNRRELEQSLQSRYRPAVLGKGIMGIGGENTMRRAGGVVFLRRAGLWGSLDRRATASWAIRGDRSELLAGHKDIELQSGQKFYVTSVTVGLDVIEIGLLTTGAASGGGHTGRLWATAAFFLDPRILAQGDMGTIEPALDQWLGQGDSVAPPAPVASPVLNVPTAHSETPAPRSELKVGMTRAQLVQAAGAPLSELSFGERVWLTYPGLVAMLEQDKLVTVDRSLQPSSKVSVRSEPAGADVLLDGKFVGSTPANLQLAAGTYSLGVRLQGYEPWQRELLVISGSDTGVQAKLEPAAAK
jgi:PEGA domain